MKDFHKGIRRLATVAIGLVFFCAGSLKLMDPVGAGLVMDEYFKFFHAAWLEPAAKAAGVAMALLETLVGAALLAGVWRKVTARITMAMMAFFTILTLILAIFNPQMDCGCFGEAIHLSHLATFLKNVVLCILCALAFLPSKEVTPTRKSKAGAFILTSLAVFGLCIYELGNLPLIDFTEFAPGASLVDNEEDEDADSGIDLSADKDSRSEVMVIYEKDGKEGAFSLDNLPDSTWTFVRVDQIERAYADYEESRPSIFLADHNGEYRNEILNEGNVMVISVYDNSRFGSDDIRKAEKFMENAMAAGFRPVFVSRERVDELDEAFTSDYKKIITLNRSNGGATFISDGEIIKKWKASGRPDAEELVKLTEQNPMEVMVKATSKGRIWYEGFNIYTLALLLLL